MKRNDHTKKKTARAAAPRQSSGTAAASSSTMLSDSPLTSDRIIKKTEEHSKTPSNTPLDRWIRNGGTPGTLDPFGVLYQTIKADCKQNGCDPEAVLIRAVLTESDKVSDQDIQRMLGDNAYYVEFLKKCTGHEDRKWVDQLLVNKKSELTVPGNETSDRDTLTPTTDREPEKLTDCANVPEIVDGVKVGTNTCITHNVNDEMGNGTKAGAKPCTTHNIDDDQKI